ncbi:calcium-binding protein [Lutimaribacter marinistellae]|uniref:Calcium-binding protein n=1 Tax=Lutimaribacter marinistellae TaxID=1820329 RepID=A0ABV7TEW5_9RHOB
MTVPLTQDLLVNSERSRDQVDTDIAVLSNGDSVYVWASEGQDGSGFGAYMQRYDSAGSTVGGERRLNVETVNSQEEVVVAPDTNGGFFAAWASFEQDGSEWGIYGQRFDASGAGLGEFRINTQTNTVQRDPAIALLEGGGHVVAWLDSDRGGPAGFGIAAQMFDTTGQKLGPEFEVEQDATFGQEDPEIAALPGGGFVVVWESFRQDGDFYGIYGRIFDASGRASGAEFHVNDASPQGNQITPDVATLTDGSFVVVWHGRDGDQGGIFARHYSAMGAPGTEFVVNASTVGDQREPAITALPDGGYYIAWTEGTRDGDGRGLFGQRFASDDSRVGPERQVNRDFDGEQFDVSLAARGNEVLVGWTSDVNSSSFEVFRQTRQVVDVYGTRQDDSLSAAPGRTVVDGLSGNDTISGSAATDWLIGGEGNDLLSGLDGFDFLDGGPGFDTADYEREGAAVVADLRNGVAATTDRLVNMEGMIGTSFSDLLFGDDADNGFGGRDGDDRIEGFDGADTISGGDGADVLLGGPGNDDIQAGSGTDTVIGGEGDDFLYGSTAAFTLTQADQRDAIFGGDGNDFIDGGLGNDELRGDAGNDTVTGGFGSDSVFGGDGDDVITGEALSDLIFGGAGDDFINGGFGFDRLNGGDGADRFFHLGIANHGSDWIQDYDAAEGDLLNYGGGSATKNDFLVQRAVTANAGDPAIAEVFVTHVPSGNLLWALVDGDTQAQLNVIAAGQVFDLLA